MKFTNAPGIPEDKATMAEAVVAIDNVLFIVPGKL